MEKRSQRDVLLEFMRERRLSQADFARKIGVYPQQITDWLNGKRNMSVRTIRKVEEIFQTRIEL